MGPPIEQWNYFLVPSNKLDSTSRRDWEDSISGKIEPATFDALKAFIRKRINTLEAVHPTEMENSSQKENKYQKSRFQKSNNNNNNTKSTSVKSHNVTKTFSKDKCILCSEGHSISFCNDFRKQPLNAQWEIVKSKELCTNCLGNHLWEDCKSERTCFCCSKRHHTVLHRDSSQSSDSSRQQHPATINSKEMQSNVSGGGTTSEATDNSAANSTSHSAGTTQGSTVLLGTALVMVKADNGRSTFARALVNPGSEITCISESLARRLHLERTPVTIPISCVGNSKTITKGSTALTITSRINKRFSYDIYAYLLEN